MKKNRTNAAIAVENTNNPSMEVKNINNEVNTTCEEVETTRETEPVKVETIFTADNFSMSAINVGDSFKVNAYTCKYIAKESNANSGGQTLYTIEVYDGEKLEKTFSRKAISDIKRFFGFATTPKKSKELKLYDVETETMIRYDAFFAALEKAINMLPEYARELVSFPAKETFILPYKTMVEKENETIQAQIDARKADELAKENRKTVAKMKTQNLSAEQLEAIMAIINQ